MKKYIIIEYRFQNNKSAVHWKLESLLTTAKDDLRTEDMNGICVIIPFESN